jgi:protein-L-isoaspartate(D-aspartate) O-methyltransferase
MDRSAKLRKFFATNIIQRAAIEDARVEQAFAAVPREPFLGPAPWFIGVAPAFKGPVQRAYLQTPDDDPAFVYRDDLIALDADREINNGVPSLHARCLHELAIEPGQQIVHIGAGTGYYSAILAQLAGPGGHVHAFEIDPALCERARQNLQPWTAVTVHARSGSSADLPAADIVYVNAGLGTLRRPWLDILKPGGRLLFPLQPKGGFGGMLLVTKPNTPSPWPTRFICRAGFIAYQDSAEDGPLDEALTSAFATDLWEQVSSLHLDTPPDETAWLSGPGWWLSTSNPA